MDNFKIIYKILSALENQWIWKDATWIASVQKH